MYDLGGKNYMEQEMINTVTEVLPWWKNIDWMFNATVGGAIATALSALATLKVAFLTRSYVRETQKMVLEMTLTRKETYRPHVIISEVKEIEISVPQMIPIDGESDGKLAVSLQIPIEIDNYGSQPITDIYVFARFELSRLYTPTITERISLIRPQQRKSAIVRVSEIEVEKVLHFLSRITYGFAPGFDELTLKFTVICKNFMGEIYVVESEFYLMPIDLQNSKVIKGWSERLKTDPDYFLWNLPHTARLKSVIEPSSLKVYAISQDQFEEKVKSLSLYMDLISLETPYLDV